MAIGFEDADILAILKLGGVDEFNQQLGDVNQKVKDGADKLATAVNVGIAAGAAALGLAVANAASFEKAMANVNTIANMDPSGLASMAESVKKIAMVNPINMTSLTGGLYELVSSGVPAAKATTSLALAAQAASAGLTGVDTAIRAGMANINAYGLPISDLTEVFDLQFQAVNVGQMNYEALAGAIGNVLAPAQNLKVPLDQLYGAIAQITLAGIDPSSATTYLGRFFSELIAKKDDLADAGLKVFDAAGNFRGLVPFLQDTSEIVKNMTPEQKASFFESMGFTEQSNKALLALVNNLNGETGYLNTMQKMAESPGAVSRAFEQQNQTFSAQAERFKNILQVNFIDVGNGLLPVLKGINDIATQNPEATRAFASGITTLAIGFAGIAAAYKGVTILTAMFSAMAASPVGLIALGVGAVAAGVLAITSAVNAADKSVIDAIGATSDNIQKVSDLAGVVETLRSKKELTKDETIKLKDAEAQLQQMLGPVGLDLDTFKGKLGDVAGAYGSVREAQLLWDLYELEKNLGSEGSVVRSIAAGVAVIAPSLSNMLNDVTVSRTGAMADRIKAIKDELEEIAIKKNADDVKKGFKAIGDEAGGTEGNGGAAKKVNALGIEIEKWKGMTEEQKKQEAFRDVTKALADNAAEAAKNMDTFIASVSANPQPVSEVIDMIGTNNTGLSGGIRGLGSNISLVTLAGNRESGFLSFLKQITSLSGESKVQMGYFADAVGRIATATGNQALQSGMSIFNDMFSAFKSGGAGGAAIAGFASLAESLWAMGGADYVPLTIEEVIASLGELGERAQEIRDFSDEMFAPFVSYYQEQIDGLLDRGTKLGALEQMYLDSLLAFVEPLKVISDNASAMEQYNSWTDDVLRFAENYTSMFGETQAVTDMLIMAGQELYNFFSMQAEGTKAYDQALYNYAKIRAEMGMSAEGLELMLGADAAAQVQEYIDMINNFGDAAYNAATGIRSFTIELDDMNKLLTDQYDQFAKDIKAAQATVEKMLYFKIDVDSTDADEKVAAAILMMQEFAGTLDTTSDAYADIQDKITEISIRYAATGASANEAAVELARQILEAQESVKLLSGKEREAMEKSIEAMISQFRTLDGVVSAATDSVGEFNDTAGNTPAVTVINGDLDDTGPTTPSGGNKNDRLHWGGYPKAHTGFLAPNETMVKMLKNEMVLRPEATTRFGAARLLEFNSTLDPQALSGGSRYQPQQTVVNIVAGNTTPDTWFKVSDKYVQPRINERTRRFEVKANPYAN